MGFIENTHLIAAALAVTFSICACSDSAGEGDGPKTAPGGKKEVRINGLPLAAQQNAYAGTSGGGDNFWSSRFGAGNYDSGNQRGYVSVPGHGPVGYGF